MVRKNKYKQTLTGVTEEDKEKAFGSMQIVWSDRRGYGKSNIVKRLTQKFVE